MINEAPCSHGFTYLNSEFLACSCDLAMLKDFTSSI